MESTDLCRNMQPIIDSFFQFSDCFASIGDYNDFFRIYVLFLYQVFDLGCHRSGFSRSGTRNEETIIIICHNSPALFVVKLDGRINVEQDVIEVFFFPCNDRVNIGIIVCGKISI